MFTFETYKDFSDYLVLRYNDGNVKFKIETNNLKQIKENFYCSTSSDIVVKIAWNENNFYYKSYLSPVLNKYKLKTKIKLNTDTYQSLMTAIEQWNKTVRELLFI